MNITLVQSKNSILYVYLVKKVEEMCTNMILSLWLLKVAIFSGIKCYWSFINWSGVFIFIKLQNLNEVNMITISGGLLKKSWEVDFFFKKFSFMLHLYMSWWAFWLIFCFFVFSPFPDFDILLRPNRCGARSTHWRLSNTNTKQRKPSIHEY